MTHILVAQNDVIRKVSDVDGTDALIQWIFPKTARIGEAALIYAASHGIFARARIHSAPKVKDELRWPGVYVGDVGEFRLLKKSVPLSHISIVMPDFGWPRCPRSFTTVKGSLVAQLEKVIADYQNKEDLA